MQSVLTCLLFQPWLSWTVPPTPRLSSRLLGNRRMPVPSPPQGKKIWGGSVMESPLNLFKWGDKPSLCVRLCSLKLLSATNGDYDWVKFCDLTHQPYMHSCFTAHRRSPEGTDIWDVYHNVYKTRVTKNTGSSANEKQNNYLFSILDWGYHVFL